MLHLDLIEKTTLSDGLVNMSATNMYNVIKPVAHNRREK